MFTLDGKQYDENEIDDKGKEALEQIRQNFAKRDEYAKLHTGTFIIEEHFTKILRPSVSEMQNNSNRINSGIDATSIPTNIVLTKPKKTNTKLKLAKKL